MFEAGFEAGEEVGPAGALVEGAVDAGGVAAPAGFADVDDGGVAVWLEREGEGGAVADVPGGGPVAHDALVGDGLLDVDIDGELAEVPVDRAARGEGAAGGVGEVGADGVLVGDGVVDAVDRGVDEAGEGEAEVLRAGHHVRVPLEPADSRGRLLRAGSCDGTRSPLAL